MIDLFLVMIYNSNKTFLCRLMKAQALGDTSSLEFMRGRRILEINPDHPIVKDLNVSELSESSTKELQIR